MNYTPDCANFSIMGKIPENFEQTLEIIAKKLHGQQYAVRGTASLVLQDIDMNVDDIDIVCDKNTAEAQGAVFSETPKYKSYFLQTIINGIKVEFMGDWQIKKTKGVWSQVYDANKSQVTNHKHPEITITTIDTELAMFTDMGRWTTFQKIKRLGLLSA